jgi:hypothetical protein
VISLSDQMAYLYRGSTLMAATTVSTGRDSKPTPTGIFNIFRKAEMYRSKKYDNAPMPYAEFFDPAGIALHAGSVSVESHGCVHLPAAFANKLFSVTHLGTPVSTGASRPRGRAACLARPRSFPAVDRAPGYAHSSRELSVRNHQAETRMARKATRRTGSKSGGGTGTKPRTTGTSVAKRTSSGGGGKSGGSAKEAAGEAFIKLLQSPFVAELVAVAATAALAALAEHGFTSGGEGARGKRAGRAVKEAGKAAAAAVGRRLANELDEIRTAAKADAKA